VTAWLIKGAVIAGPGGHGVTDLVGGGSEVVVDGGAEGEHGDDPGAGDRDAGRAQHGTPQPAGGHPDP